MTPSLPSAATASARRLCLEPRLTLKRHTDMPASVKGHYSNPNTFGREPPSRIEGV